MPFPVAMRTSLAGGPAAPLRSPAPSGSAGWLTDCVETITEWPGERGRVADQRSGGRRIGRSAGRARPRARRRVRGPHRRRRSASVTGPTATVAAPATPGFGKAQAQLLMLDPRLGPALLRRPLRPDGRRPPQRGGPGPGPVHSTCGLIGGSLTGRRLRRLAARRSSRPAAPAAPGRLARPGRTPRTSRSPKGPSPSRCRPIRCPTPTPRRAWPRRSCPACSPVDGVTDSTTSGVDAVGVALVEAEVEVAHLTLVGGVVDLRGLQLGGHVNRAGAKPVGTFTIGAASIGGTPRADPGRLRHRRRGERRAVAAGHRAPAAGVPPRGRHDLRRPDQGRDRARTPTRDQVAGAVLEALQPAREPLFQALLDANCNSAALITVTDILLGSVTGGGSLTAVVGGAQAQLSPDPGASPRRRRLDRHGHPPAAPPPRTSARRRGPRRDRFAARRGRPRRPAREVPRPRCDRRSRRPGSAPPPTARWPSASGRSRSAPPWSRPTAARCARPACSPRSRCPRRPRLRCPRARRRPHAG